MSSSRHGRKTKSPGEPPTPDALLHLFLDGVRYSIAIAEITYRRLEEAIGKLNPVNLADRAQSYPLAIEIVADAWAFVDTIHRLRELIQQFPGLKHQTPERREFLSRTESFGALRNYVQHYRSGIDPSIPHRRTLWGTVSWNCRREQDSAPAAMLIAAGTLMPPMEVPTLSYDTQLKCLIGGLTLDAGFGKVDLTEAMAAIRNFATWFAHWLDEHHHGKKLDCEPTLLYFAIPEGFAEDWQAAGRKRYMRFKIEVQPQQAGSQPSGV